MSTDDNAARRLIRLDQIDEQKQDAEETLAALNEERRHLIHDLFYLDRVSAGEIAQRLLITPQMVRRLAHHHAQRAHAIRKAARA